MTEKKMYIHKGSKADLEEMTGKEFEFIVTSKPYCGKFEVDYIQDAYEKLLNYASSITYEHINAFSGFVNVNETIVKKQDKEALATSNKGALDIHLSGQPVKLKEE